MDLCPSGAGVAVACADRLIAMKRARGQARDESDIEALRMLAGS